MNPYATQPQKAFWKPAVADKSMFDISEIWDPKFNVKPRDNIVTYGSCFAQHIGNAMQARGFSWLRSEQPPFGMGPENLRAFNYDIFSARTGNIYTTSLLRQWCEWALDAKPVPNEIWKKGDRYIDPFRPRIEPNGFASPDELIRSREETIRAFRRGVERARFFVFTLGLTESWTNTEQGYEYPMCPGTVAGEFSEDQHRFENQSFQKVLTNLSQAMALMRGVNPTLRFLLTVSPVPLTATMSGKHVVVATMASKSVLRAVAGQLSDNQAHVDYFPSYEIINSPIFRGGFFEPNQRNVNPVGVDFVMENFFRCLESKFGVHGTVPGGPRARQADMDLVCEEALLGAFQNA
jgi:hypothetical protein